QGGDVGERLAARVQHPGGALSSWLARPGRLAAPVLGGCSLAARTPTAVAVVLVEGAVGDAACAAASHGRPCTSPPGPTGGPGPPHTVAPAAGDRAPHLGRPRR